MGDPKILVKSRKQTYLHDAVTVKNDMGDNRNLLT